MSALDALLRWTLGLLAMFGAASVMAAYFAIARDVVLVLAGSP